ncbi:PucR family transcriptional regulator [Streptomyces avicenniae]|uniref:PucR family transcriptional regulator n=1 Tax=Streptomyces avicenniae TaxID=500153 RepID=UPI00069BFF32|nr:helix-turn-helix domain-containing protein [Streptomyces avicenniae]
MTGTEYQELIDEACALLGTPATLEGRDFGLIAYGAHDSADDRVMDPVRTRSILSRRSTAAVRTYFEGFGITRAEGPVRIPPDPDAGVRTGRLCLPVRHGGVVYGYIWLLDDGATALDDPRLVGASDVADRIGTRLAAEARAGARLGELLRAALSPAGRSRELAAALGAAADGPLTLVALAPWPEGRDTPAGLPGAIAVSPMGRGGPHGALAVLARPAGARTVGMRLRELFGGAAGVGGAREGVADLADAWTEALAAARTAVAEERFGGLADWAALGPYRLLTALPDAAPDPAVAPLLGAEHRELARTAEVFLDHAGQAARTAAALGIHRQTLYYRVSRIERLTGLDLADGEDRLLLHMSLKSGRLRGV